MPLMSTITNGGLGGSMGEPDFGESYSLDAKARAYYDAVAARLGNVDVSERHDLLSDLAEHLTELSSEPGVDLSKALGAPEAYAAELLGSAGISPTERPGGPGLAGHINQRWSRLRSQLTGDINQRRSSLRSRYDDFLANNPEARPIGWFLRGWAIAVVLGGILGGDIEAIPEPFDSPFVGLFLLAGCIAWSVHWGRTHANIRDRATVLVAATTAFCALIAFFGIAGASNSSPTYVYMDGPGMTGPPGCLTRADGRPIQNIYAYDEAGDLLESALLFDDQGRPFDDLCPEDYDDQGRQLTTEYRTDLNGATVANVFPRTQYWVEDTNRDGYIDPATEGKSEAARTPVRPPAVVIPRLEPTSGDVNTDDPSEGTAVDPGDESDVDTQDGTEDGSESDVVPTTAVDGETDAPTSTVATTADPAEADAATDGADETPLSTGLPVPATPGE